LENFGMMCFYNVGMSIFQLHQHSKFSLEERQFFPACEHFQDKKLITTITLLLVNSEVLDCICRSHICWWRLVRFVLILFLHLNPLILEILNEIDSASCSFGKGLNDAVLWINDIIGKQITKIVCLGILLHCYGDYLFYTLLKLYSWSDYF
jgi:hypothetical protein